MKILRIISLAAAVSVGAAPLFSCGKKRNAHGEPPVQVVKETITAEPTSIQPTATFPDYPVSYPDIEPKDTGNLYEAEKAQFRGSLKIDYDNDNYSGEGYVTGFAANGSTAVIFSVNAPSNQHYDISFNIAAAKETDCRITINDSQAATFKTAADSRFTQITIHGVFLVKGRSTIELRPENGNICLDYLKLENSSSLGDIKYDADGKPVNKNAGEAARKLLGFLSDSYGKYIITGQYAADDDNSELDLIYETTGKYPVIRFSNFTVPRGTVDESFKSVDACADWYRNGGISCVSWYWSSPSAKSSIRTDESDFNLSAAVTDTDIAMLSQEEVRGLYGEGKISEQTYSLILDIDNMAGQLTSLKNKGIPVLWRPLPEGSGDWYWWGASGPEAYKWLWQLLYTRLTDYFELDNLIWIWNGQSESTLVKKSTYDIAAADLYVNKAKDYGDRFYEKFAAIQKAAGSDKLIAISECGSVPDIDSSFRDNSVWSFFGLWSGKYVEDENGGYSEEFTSRENLIRTYNSTGALTLDEYRRLTGMDKDGVSPEATVPTTAPPPTTAAATEETTGA